jgi:hypothetical protein
MAHLTFCEAVNLLGYQGDGWKPCDTVEEEWLIEEVEDLQARGQLDGPEAAELRAIWNGQFPAAPRRPAKGETRPP